MFAQADANKDQKVSRAEFTALADTWFDRLDPEKTGQGHQPSSSPSASTMPSRGRRTLRASDSVRPGTTAPQPQHRARFLHPRRCRQGWFPRPVSN